MGPAGRWLKVLKLKGRSMMTSNGEIMVVGRYMESKKDWISGLVVAFSSGMDGTYCILPRPPQPLNDSHMVNCHRSEYDLSGTCVA